VHKEEKNFVEEKKIDKKNIVYSLVAPPTRYAIRGPPSAPHARFYHIVRASKKIYAKASKYQKYPFFINTKKKF